MQFAFGEFELDEALFELRHRGRRVPVQPKVLRLLLYLLIHRQRVVPSDELLRAVWPDETVSAASLRRAVKCARSAVGDTGGAQTSIQTVVGRGYRFIRHVDADPAPTSTTRPITRAESSAKASNRDGLDAASVVEDPFVGRDATLSLLEGSLQRAILGSGSVSVLSGEPGIGKTRLAHELAARATELGADALIGRCMEVDGAPPFWPWLQILRQCVALRGAAEVRRLLGSGTADVIAALPALRDVFPDEPAPGSDESHARFRLFDSMARFWMRAARERPLTLVFDDLQRADQPTLHLLVFLASQVRGARILVLGTSRPAAERDPEVSRLLGDLLRSDGSTLISLTGLQRSDVSRYFELTVGAVPPDGVSNAVHEQTGGNPLFLRQLVHNFSAAGRPPGWTWLQRIGDDRNLQESIERWLERLSETCRTLLQVGAVIGREFSPAILARAAELPPASVLQALCEAERAGVLRRLDGPLVSYRYAHALVRDLLYDQLAHSDRARFHGLVAAAMRALNLEADPDKLAELAHHFLQAAPVYDEGLALVYAERAARVAVARLAHEEAALHFDRALHLLALTAPDDARAQQLLLEKGEALACADHVVEARAALDAAVDTARRRSDVDALVRAAMAMSRPLEYAVMDRPHVRLLEDLLELLPASDPRRALLQAVLAKSLLYAGELEQRLAMARAAVRSARGLGDARTLAKTLHCCVQALSEPEQHSERGLWTDQLIELARAQHDHQLLLHARLAQLQTHLELGELAAVDRAISNMQALSAHVREPYFRWTATSVRAMRATIAGNLSLAEELAGEALRFGGRFFDAAAHTVHCVQMTGIWCLQGRIATAEAAARQISSRYPGLAGWRAILAFLEAQLGYETQARHEFQRLVDRDLESARRDPFVLSTLAPLADLGALVGDATGVQAVYDALKPYAGYHAVVMGGMFTHGPIERHLGMLAAKLQRFDAAAAHYERAIQLIERMNAPPYLSLTLQSYGLLLAKSRRPEHRERAALELSRALSLSRSHGVHQVSAFCLRAARRFGIELADLPRPREVPGQEPRRSAHR